jgi:hypothetical protein
MTTAYDRWKTSPPEEPEPADYHYELAEEQIIFTKWYEETLYNVSEGKEPTDEDYEKLRASDGYQQRIAEMAYEIMEEEIENSGPDFSEDD